MKNAFGPFAPHLPFSFSSSQPRHVMIIIYPLDSALKAF
jgi:hypothetical protein